MEVIRLQGSGMKHGAVLQHVDGIILVTGNDIFQSYGYLGYAWNGHVGDEQSSVEAVFRIDRRILNSCRCLDCVVNVVRLFCLFTLLVASNTVGNWNVHSHIRLHDYVGDVDVPFHSSSHIAIQMRGKMNVGAYYT